LKNEKYSESLIDLIEKLLVLDPKKRLNIDDVMNHHFLKC